MAAPPSMLASARIPLPQFMIAIVLLKSKPDSVSAEEYLARLRKTIKIERRSSYKLFAYRRLDSATYRANAQAEAQQTILTLHARIAELGSKRQGLPTFMDSAPEINDRHTTLSGGRRKRKTSDPGNRPKKLARQARVANSSSPLQARPNNLHKAITMTGIIAPEAVASTLRIPKDAFLNHVYLLQQEIENPKPEPKLIAACLERCFEVAGQIASSVELREPLQAPSIPDSVYNHNRLGAENSLSIHQVIAKLLPILHKAMDHLEGANGAPNVGGVLTYKFVRLYEEILSHVCKIWKSSGSVKTRKITDHGEEREIIKDQVQDPETFPQRQPRIILDLCELAIAMMATLNPGKCAQLCMLEGCLSVLLNRIGNGLKTCVFDKTIITARHNSSRSVQQRRREVLGGESGDCNPCLVYILRRAPDLQDENTFQHPEETLLTLTKKKLQHTLLNSVFGEDTLGLLRQSLDMPTPPTELQQMEGVEEIKARDWYTSEVWQLVGWDVLDDYLRQPLSTPKVSTAS